MEIVMPSGRFQVAVCQLECHPALVVGDIDYVAEPVLPASGVPSLATLARFSLDVADLQDECRCRYIDWQAKRIRAVLSKLATVKPVPQLIVFPEAAVPFELLGQLRDFAVEHSITIVAGTHTLHLTKQRAKQYRALGIDKQELKSWGEAQFSSNAVLPIFSGDRSFFHLKGVPAVFEITDVKRRIDRPNLLRSFPVRLGSQSVKLTPLVCAEALQRHEMPRDYDLIIICAHNPSTTPFDPFIKQHIGNRVPVVLINDGRYGGSGVHAVIDKRIQSWWWSEPHNGRLPKGDGILIVELDWDHMAPQVGIADPQPAAHLIACHSLVYEGAASEDHDVSTLLHRASEHSDPTTQAELITQAIGRSASPIQQIKVVHLRRLSERGSADAAWWAALGDDCSVPSLSDLRALERELCALCAARLHQLLTAGVIQEEALLGKVAALAQLFRKEAAFSVAPATATAASPAERITIIDRRTECDEIRQCLANPRMSLCLVHGLNAVGKTSVIETAITQAGYRSVYRVTTAPDTTPPLLVELLMRQLGEPASKTVDDPLKLIRSDVPPRLPASTVIVLEHAQNLIQEFLWRDPSMPQVLAGLADVLRATNSTLVVESDVFLEVPVVDAARLRRIWIRGLSDDDGLLFLDQQLRRAGLSPDHYGEDQRRAIVKGLGGHPGAIVLASEYVEEAGIDQVVGDIASRHGIHGDIVRKIVRRLHLSDEQSHVISLLSLARVPIPAVVLSKVVAAFNPLPVVRQLQRMALVERFARDFVAVAGLISGYADLPIPQAETATAFHLAAAREFARLAERAETAVQLRWAVEARYHAYAAGSPSMAPDLGLFADGALGALKVLVDQENYEKARPIAEDLLRHHRSPEILELTALVYARLGKCEEALTLAKEAISKQPQRVWILTEVGRCALHVHQIDIAENAVRIAKATGTDSAFIAVLEGKVHQRKDDPDAAIAAFRRGTQLPRRDGWPFFYLGRALVRRGDVHEALEILHEGEQVEQTRPRPNPRILAAIRTQLAITYVLDDDLENAQRWIDLLADEATPEVARVTAYVELRGGQKDAIERAMQRLDPSRIWSRHDRAQAHLFRSMFYAAVGNREQASEELNQAHQADPRNVFVLLRWACVLIEIALDARAEREHEAVRVCAERAQEVCKKILEFNKNNPEALRLLERIADEFNVL